VALAFDAVGPSSAGTTATSSKPVTWSHTCTGTNLVLLVGMAFDNVAFSTLGTLTVTYAGAAMTFVGNWPGGGAGQTAGDIAVWKKIAPATGANTVSVSWSTGTPYSVCGGSLSFSGADQTTGIGSVTNHDSAAANATAWTTGTITTTAGNILVAFVTNGSSGTTFTTGTSRFIDTTAPGGGGAADFTAAGTLASTGSDVIGGAMTSDWYAVMAFEVLPAAATGFLVGVATGTGTAQTAGTSPHNTLAGPAYAGTATDLGGVYGAWATTQFATGGP
jgi:hypothetical protein